ncbi:DUF305 domain-containing protein [Rhizobium leguminosarum]|uniref:DUF305 domain-containing protein n=1 Tax=Rhizobium leguminosarum TaxID=384 RepID=UPI0021B12495|nr:DUF305 domain-containing protein [Rhizobium leguminosarum]
MRDWQVLRANAARVQPPMEVRATSSIVRQWEVWQSDENFEKFEFRTNLPAAALLGLISSTFSTLVSQFIAGRIGRDAAVDWMVVAAIPFRESVIITPSWGAIIGGILFHPWADFSWVIVFFVLLGRWTAQLRPRIILIIAVPWALFTSAMEWLFLVPLFPFWQPIFPLEQTYWIGFGVHLTSASMYPIFPALRDRLAGRQASPHRRFALVWNSLAAAGVLTLGIIAFLGGAITMANKAIKHAEDPRVVLLAHAISHSQSGEIDLMKGVKGTRAVRNAVRSMFHTMEDNSRISAHNGVDEPH